MHIYLSLNYFVSPLFKIPKVVGYFLMDNLIHKMVTYKLSLEVGAQNFAIFKEYHSVTALTTASGHP